MKISNINKHFKSVLLIAIILSSLTSYAQQCINYKAVIKNNSGNIVNNQNIQLRFNILVLDSGNQEVLIYRETHSPTTDANGIAIACIGEGTQPLGVFEQVEWDRYNHYLKVEVDIGDGFIDLGNTPFTAVPVALNVNGLEKVYGDNTIGWRLKGKNPEFYGLTGDESVDLSDSDGNAPGIAGATGLNSFSTGFNTMAIGTRSTAMGSNTAAFGTTSTTMGFLTEAHGKQSLAIGRNTKAESFVGVALGRNNIGGGNSDEWVTTDPLFEIGNGISDNDRSNAFTVYKNGIVNINDAYNLPQEAGVLGQVLTTLGDGTTVWFPSNNNASGLEAINEGNGVGYRLIGKNSNNYGNIGEQSLDVSTSDAESNILGATGISAFAAGSNTRASGARSTALGSSTIASGPSATSLGFITEASGHQSLAVGRGINAFAFATTAVGIFNIGGGTSQSDWVATDPIFEVGNGTSDNNRSNALTVYKNGVVNIGGAYNMPLSTGVLGQVLTSTGDGNTLWANIGDNSNIPTLIDVTTFGTNYEAFGNGYEEPRFYIDNNRVQIEGVIRNTTGSIGLNEVLFILPVGYRPNKIQVCLGQTDGTFTNNLRIDVYPDGRVGASATSIADQVSLNGISFRID